MAYLPSSVVNVMIIFSCLKTHFITQNFFFLSLDFLKVWIEIIKFFEITETVSNDLS